MDEFVSEWKNRGNEKQDSHQFWDFMFRTFWKIVNPTNFQIDHESGESQNLCS